MAAQNRAVSDLPARVDIDAGTVGTGQAIDSGDLGAFDLGEDDFGGGVEYARGMRRVEIERTAFG